MSYIGMRNLLWQCKRVFPCQQSSFELKWLNITISYTDFNHVIRKSKLVKITTTCYCASSPHVYLWLCPLQQYCFQQDKLNETNEIKPSKYFEQDVVSTQISEGQSSAFCLFVSFFSLSLFYEVHLDCTVKLCDSGL